MGEDDSMTTISYEDLGQPVVAGQYSYQDMLIDVGASQISDWESNPLLRFDLIHTYDNRYSIGATAPG